VRYEAEIQGAVKGTDLYYVLVRYFAQDGDRNPTLVEEHLMQLHDEGTRVVTDAEGRYQLADGSFIAPDELEHGVEYEFARETFKRDVLAEMAEAFARRWEVAEEQKHSGDWTSDPTKPAFRDGQLVRQRPETKPVEVENRDPRGVSARPDVAPVVKPRPSGGPRR
jgi:hypothetical protein